MNTTYQTLLLETDDAGICVLSINRPDKLNALNDQVFKDLDKAISEIEESGDIKGLIITGAGDKAFVAGADIKEFSAFTKEQATKLSQRGHRVFQKIEDLGKPVIAAINGYALGGGCELALSCHLRIASGNAVLGLPEVSLGLIPGYGATQRLPKLVGEAKALELVMTGRFAKADEAAQIGLVNKVAEEDVLQESKGMLKSILKQAPIAIKNAILAIRESGSSTGYETEANLFGDLFNTADFKEGTTAFLEKRKPDFSGK